LVLVHAGPAAAWRYDCEPASLLLCSPAGECAPGLYGNGFRLVDGIIETCRSGRCVRESQLMMSVNREWVQASGTAMFLMVNRGDGRYLRNYSTPAGTLMENGKCTAR
jgi:hypothetical protein